MDRADSLKYYIENPDGINDVSKPYACFHYGIKWIPEVIAGHKYANGYIVQRVRIEAPKFLFGFHCKDYYEAWAVENGIVTYPEETSGSEDDIFEYSSDGICESLFKKGTIRYAADVFWIDTRSSLYSVVDQWEYNTVKQARELLKSSMEFKECTIPAVFCRPMFVFNFDFCDEKLVFRTMYRIGQNMYSSNRKSDIYNYSTEYSDVFKEAGKEVLFSKILNQLAAEFGIGKENQV